MTFGTMRLSTYNDTSSPFSDGWMAGLGFFPVVMSPIVALTGLCLVSLLVLGVLWLEGRDQDSRLQTPARQVHGELRGVVLYL